MPDAVLEYGLRIINEHKSQAGDEYYLFLEEVFNASIDFSMFGLSLQCLKKIKSNFPDSQKVVYMQIAYNQANPSADETLADKIIDKALNENKADFTAMKMRIAQLRSQGLKDQFIQELNSYLEQNPLDAEAWLELSDIYQENMNYSKAAYCMEEVIQIFPKKLFYMIKLAEIYYTLGSGQNFLNAKNYYCYVLSKDSTNIRALWGLQATCKKLLKNKKGEENIQQLLTLTQKQIKEQYSQHKQENLISNYKFE